MPLGLRRVAGIVVAAGGIAAIGLAAQRKGRPPPSRETRSSTFAYHLLSRAAPLLRLPTSPDQPPEVLSDGSGLRCPMTGRVFPYRNGVLDLLAQEVTLTDTQHVLNTPLSAWAYDHARSALIRLVGAPDFPQEVRAIQNMLWAGPGDVVVDLACGHGYFTVEWAKRVGPEGLVLGLDISPAMLARAANAIEIWGLTNVLLIRGDAQHLPFADGSMPKVNCSGGFHQFPDLSQGLREIARVSSENAVLTASTFAEGSADPNRTLKHWLREHFALHFVPLDWLGSELALLGYDDYQSTLPGGWFGYATARRSGGRA
jgi:ubiquinone/menaquinone biosynthesis C-methylase UbiE